jgi:hypothetical protein
MNMKIASINFFAAILFSAIAIAPLGAQTNAPAEEGVSNPIAATGTNHQKVSSAESSPVHIDNPGVHPGLHSGGQNAAGVKVPGVEVYASGKPAHEEIVAIVGFFSAIVAIFALGPYFGDRRSKRWHETLRAMIDKGVPITPELLAHSRDPRNDLRSGLILVGMGTGLIVLGGKVGLILLFIGVALLIVWLVEKRNKNDEQPRKP